MTDIRIIFFIKQEPNNKMLRKLFLNVLSVFEKKKLCDCE